MLTIQVARHWIVWTLKLEPVGASGALRAHPHIIVEQVARVPNALQYFQNFVQNFIVLVQGD